MTGRDYPATLLGMNPAGSPGNSRFGGRQGVLVITPLFRLVAGLLVVAAAASRGASQDKPAPEPNDPRRSVLIKAGYTAVPLTYNPKNFCFFVDGAIDTEKVKFFIDSGFGQTVIDTKVAKALKLELGKETTSQGIGGKWTGRATDFNGMRIGQYDTGKDWSGLEAEAGDLSGWKSAPGAVIGMYILDPLAAVIDYHARTLYLRPPLVSAWPRLADTWEVTSWQEDGAPRKLDPKAPPLFTFANQRLKVTDGGTTREFDISFGPNDEGDYLVLRRYGREKPEAAAAGGRIRIKDGRMTACMRLHVKKGEELAMPTEFAAPKGSGLVLLELEQTTPAADRKKPVDPLREMLVKEGYTAVPLDRQPDGSRRLAARTGKHDLRLILDTGCSLATFDTAALKKWGGKVSSRADFEGLGNKSQGDLSILGDLRIGDYDTKRSWGGVECFGTDLADLNKVLTESKRKPIDGLLGNLTLHNGSAVIDYHTNTLYLRPLKDTLWPKLEGKWKGVAQEMDGRRGRYADANAPTVEFKDGRYMYSSRVETKEWAFHVQEYGPHYRVGLFDPKADGPPAGEGYPAGFIFKLLDGTLTVVMVIDPAKAKGEPTEFAAPRGSGLVLIEFVRAK